MRDTIITAVRFIAFMAIVSVAKCTFADTWIDPDSGLSWTYTVINDEISLGAYTGNTYVTVSGGTYYNGYSGIAIPTSTAGSLVIPSTIAGYPVTAIGERAFRYCDKLTSVAIPDSITSFGDLAFEGCSGLRREVCFDYGFDDLPVVRVQLDFCTVLRELPNPRRDGYKFAGWFYQSPSGEIRVDAGFVVKDNMILTAKWLFIEHESVDDVEWAFVQHDGSAEIVSAECLNGDVQIPSTLGGTPVGKICEGCFIGNVDILSVVIPSSVTNIGGYAFCDCTNIASVTFSEGLAVIGSGAFANCKKLKSVSLPASLKNLGEHIAKDRSRYGIYSEGYEKYSDYALRFLEDWDVISQSDGIVSECSDGILSVTRLMPEGSMLLDYGVVDFVGYRSTAHTITETVSGGGLYTVDKTAAAASCHNIALGVFEGCSSLENVSLSEGLSVIGAAVFRDCASLKKLAIPQSVVSIGGYCEHTIDYVQTVVAYTNCATCVNLEIGGFADGCVNLACVSLPLGLEYLGPRAFAGCTSLKSIDLPDTLTYLAEGMFAGCLNLEDVTLPTSLELIGGYKSHNSFAYMGAEKYATSAKRSVTTSSVDVVSGGGLYTTSVISYNRGSEVETYDEDGNYRSCRWGLLSACDGTNEVEIAIAYEKASAADNPWLPDHDYGFTPPIYSTDRSDYLGELLAFIVAKKVSSMEGTFELRRRFHPSTSYPVEGVFAGCTSLKSIVLPQTVRRIADNAFYNCVSLEMINVPTSLERVGCNAFAGTASLPDISAPWQGYVDVVDSMIAEGKTWSEIAAVFESVGELILNASSGLTKDELLYASCAFVNSVSYAVRKLADDAVCMDSVQTFEGIHIIFNAFVEIMENFGSRFTKEVKNFLIERFMDDASYVVRKLAENAEHMKGLQGIEGMAEIFDAAADCMRNWGSTLTKDLKNALVERFMDDASYVVRKLADSAENMEGLQKFTGMADILYAEVDCMSAFGSTFTKSVKNALVKRAVDDASYAVRKLADSAENMEGLQKFTGIADILYAEVDCMSAFGSTFTLEVKNALVERCMDDASYAVNRLSDCADAIDGIRRFRDIDDILYTSIECLSVLGSSFGREKIAMLIDRLFEDAICVVRNLSGRAIAMEEFALFEHMGDIYCAMSECLRMRIIGQNISSDCKSRIATAAMRGAYYVMSSTQKYRGVDNMLLGLNSLLNSLGNVAVASAQKSNIEGILVDMMLHAIYSGDSDGIPLVTLVECLDLIEAMSIDPVPVLGVNATMDDVSVELEDMADPALCEIIESPADYAEFRLWAKSVSGGASAVKASQHAAVSYMLGANVLFDSEPTIDLSDVEVDDGSGDESDKGAITLSVTVADGGNPVAVASERVAAMFEATSSLGDWYGESKLTPTVEILEGDGATMRFRVKPGDGTAKSAFLRIMK